jgi:hypothetical protein
MRKPSISFGVIVGVVLCVAVPGAMAQQHHEQDKKTGALPRKANAGKKSPSQKPHEMSRMSTAPAPKSGSMPTGPAPSGKLGTEPLAKGKLGTDPKPGDPKGRPPRPQQ